MGEVCAKLADFSILTEDNNRFEKVEDIIADIKTGMALSLIHISKKLLISLPNSSSPASFW